MTLSVSSVEWAIDFLGNHSDGDLFPRVLELDAIRDLRTKFSGLTAGKDLGDFAPGAHRRFIVPKDDISYRQATQLHPQDSILLSAAVFQYGQQIEGRRLPADHVFSYRFNPTAEHGLYSSQHAWNEFWTAASRESHGHPFVLYCDIADFYNQIYHHTLENQLIASGLPNQTVKWIIRLVESTTAGVSRGVPIGPHAIHLLAEATLIPIDNSMRSAGLRFLRYADDILIFCESEKAAKNVLANIASILDRQQRLTLQRHKTRVLAAIDFRALCTEMIQDRPISRDEDRLLKLIEKYSGGDPYKAVSYDRIDPNDWRMITEPIIRGIVTEYIDKEPIDYIRLRWFFRRLAQIGHPGAIDVSLDNLDKLGPCFANICLYLVSVQTIDQERWRSIGTRLLGLLESDEVRSNEYFRLSILSLFTRNSDINHFDELATRFQASDPYARREILLAAKKSKATDWLREHKEGFSGMDPWLRMAFIYCAADFPGDERRYFINQWAYDTPFDATLAKWAKS